MDNVTDISTLDIVSDAGDGDTLLLLQKDGALKRFDISALLKNNRGSGAKIGDISMWCKSELPEDCLVLNGTTFDKAKYPDLFVFLGTDRLEDWRDRVPRGAGNLIKLGELQEDAMKDLKEDIGILPWHQMKGGSFDLVVTGDKVLDATTGGWGNPVSQGWANDRNSDWLVNTTLHLDFSKAMEVAPEIRVKAIGVHFIIKAVK